MAGHKEVKGNLCEENGRWVVRARVYDPVTGKVKHRSHSTGYKVKDSTRRKAEQAMRRIIEEWKKEANTVPVKTEPLFSEYIYKWLDKKSISLRANSMKSYREYADKHILPALGNVKVRKLTLQQLQSYYNEKLRTLSVASLKKQHVVVSGALLDAVRDGVIPVNFAAYVEFPKARKFEGKSYTEEQVAALLEASEKEGEPIHAAILLAVCYGLRRSEICGLRWKDIDFKENILMVRNTVTQNGALIIDMEETKTKKSRRTIDLIESTVPYLEKLKEVQEEHGLTLDKVCVWPDGREVRPNYITHRCGEIMKKYGLEHIRLHDLRHTAATLLAKKAGPKQVQSFLGHEDISTTMNIYTHLLEEDRRKTSKIMDEVLRGARISPEFCSEKCSDGQKRKKVG